jgi:chromosome segregation ATPase
VRALRPADAAGGRRVTATIEPDDLEVRIEQLEDALDEAEAKINTLTEERDSLQRENTELAEKVDTAKDQAEELLRGLA